MAFSLQVARREGAFVKLIFLSSILLFSSLLFAENSCLSHLDSAQKSFNHALIYQNHHYKLLKVGPGQYGGNLVMVAKAQLGLSWAMTGKAEYKNAPPGSPLMTFKALPQFILEHFKFKILDDKSFVVQSPYGSQIAAVVMPDVPEINAGLKKLDQILTNGGFDGIPFRFSLEEGIKPVRTFLENNLKHSQFPFATESEIAYHDLNYHFSPMFILNGKMIEASNRQTEIFLKFVDWLKKNHPKDANEKLLESILEIRSSHIDLTGNLSLFLENPHQAEGHEHALLAVKAYVGWSKSPADYLADSIKAKQKDPRDSEVKNLKFDMVSEFIKTLSEKDFEANTETSLITQNIKLLEGSIKNRFLEIQMALQGLSKKELDRIKPRF